MRFTYYHVSFVAYFFTFIISKISGKPYQYSYFIQQPGQYHSLHVKNGAAIFNNIPPYEPKTYLIPSESSGEPLFRQGRFGPGFVEQNPFTRQFSGRNPENDGTNNNFPQRREQNPYTPSEVDPFFNQPRRRYPQNFPREDNGIRFNSQPPDLGRPYPENNFNNYFRSEFSGKNFNTYQQLKDDRQIKIKSQKPQIVLEIDETRDREEVSTTTTPNSCIFCGVNEVNPQDGETVNPDSESVDPNNVSSKSVPPFLIANNVANKRANFPTLIPYYLVVSN